jgi:D-glycero-D-manno-heptose 1,7-bisphosphate phosphatase
MITMVCGAPASGKSTLTKEYINKGFISLNRDTEGGTIIGLLPKMEALLSDNKDIVLDNLFPTVEARAPFIQAAKKFNVDIECVLMGTSIEDSQFNAVQRMINLTGKFLSPEEVKASKHPNIFPPVVLFKYKKEFEKPKLEEGFSKITVVPFLRKIDPSFVNKAVIFDYDGTLRECIGGNGKYPVNKDQIKILPNRKEVIEKFNEMGYLLLGISNQSGIAKKDLTYQECDQLFQYTNKLLGFDIYYRFCSHAPTPPNCYCRKPQVGLFVSLMNEYKLDPKKCIFVGDSTSDKTLSTRCGMKYYDQAEFFK